MWTRATSRPLNRREGVQPSSGGSPRVTSAAETEATAFGHCRQLEERTTPAPVRSIISARSGSLQNISASDAGAASCSTPSTSRKMSRLCAALRLSRLVNDCDRPNLCGERLRGDRGVV